MWVKSSQKEDKSKLKTAKSIIKDLSITEPSVDVCARKYAHAWACLCMCALSWAAHTQMTKPYWRRQTRGDKDKATGSRQTE